MLKDNIYQLFNNLEEFKIGYYVGITRLNENDRKNIDLFLAPFLNKYKSIFRNSIYCCVQIALRVGRKKIGKNQKMTNSQKIPPRQKKKNTRSLLIRKDFLNCKLKEL